jgi:hypothetical protein
MFSVRLRLNFNSNKSYLRALLKFRDNVGVFYLPQGWGLGVINYSYSLCVVINNIIGYINYQRWHYSTYAKLQQQHIRRHVFGRKFRVRQKSFSWVKKPFGSLDFAESKVFFEISVVNGDIFPAYSFGHCANLSYCYCVCRWKPIFSGLVAGNNISSLLESSLTKVLPDLTVFLSEVIRN